MMAKTLRAAFALLLAAFFVLAFSADGYSVPPPTGTVLSVDSWTERQLSYASLVHQDVSHPTWAVGPAQPPSARPLAGDSTAPGLGKGLRSLVYVNEDGACSPVGWLERAFWVPTGVTGIRLSALEVQNPSGVTSAASALQLYDHTGITQVSSTAFTPSNTSTTIRSGTITVTPGLRYRYRIPCNVAGSQAKFLIGAVSAQPVTSSDPFWLSFKRLELFGSLQDSNETAWPNADYPPQSEGAHVDLLTNARGVRIGINNRVGDYIGAGNAALTPVLDGYPLDPPVQGTVSVTSYQAVAIPAGGVTGGLRLLTIPAGPDAGTVLPDPVKEPRGAFLTDVFLPWSAVVKVLPAPVETIVIYGDSKLADFYSDSSARDSVEYLLRARASRVIAEAFGGRLLWQDTTAYPSIDSCRPFARKIARLRPSRIVVGISRNDFANGQMTAANVGTQMGYLIDALHEAAGEALIHVFTYSSETTESAVSAVAWDTMRASLVALCGQIGTITNATRSTWCTVLDAARLWTPAQSTTYTADGVHPNSHGQMRLTDLIGGWRYPWSPADLAPYIWLESAPGPTVFTGAVAGAVSSAGTTPPVVTLSGTPAVGSNLRLEVTTAGTLGNALFRASLDGGRSWWLTGQPTSASSALSPSGITAAFAAGSASADNTYSSNALMSQWLDLSGNGRNFVQATAGVRPSYKAAGPGNMPTVDTSATPRYFGLTGLSVPAPWTVIAVGQITNPAAVGAIVGAQSAGAGPTMISGNSTQVIVNDNTNQITATATQALTVIGATNTAFIQITTSTPHNYVTGETVTISGVGGNTNANTTVTITVTSPTQFMLNSIAGNAPYTSGGTSTANVLQSPFCLMASSNGASSWVRLNGTQTNGTLANVTITSLYAGDDWFGHGWDRNISAVVVVARQITSSEALEVEAWARAKYGTQ